mgnify:CR=1 FL=1
MTEKLSKELFDWKTIISNRLEFVDIIFINNVIERVASLEKENERLKREIYQPLNVVTIMKDVTCEGCQRYINKKCTEQTIDTNKVFPMCRIS